MALKLWSNAWSLSFYTRMLTALGRSSPAAVRFRLIIEALIVLPSPSLFNSLLKKCVCLLVHV